MFKTAVILAGGEGSRLKTITKVPKPLICVNGKPHIINIINHIFLWNFSKVIILVKKDQTKLYETNLQKLCKEVLEKLTIAIVEEKEPMGTSGWVLQNLELLDNHFMILNADTYFYENIYSTLLIIYQKKQNALIAKGKESRNDSGSFKVNEYSKIEKFEEKSNDNNNLESAGIYLLKKECLQKLNKNYSKVKSSFEFDVFPDLIKQQNLFGYKCLKFNHDYGTINRLNNRNEIIQKHQIKWLFIDRDNTLNYDFNSYTYKISELKRVEIIDPILKGYQDNGYHLCVITNQSGIARGFYGKKDMEKFNNALYKQLQKVGINIQLFLYCPHMPDDGCDCRKPNTGLLNYIDEIFGIDLDNSIFLGDSESDILCAKNFKISSLKLNLVDLP